MTFVFWWPVLYGLVLLGVVVLWVKTDDRNQKTGVRNRKSENRGRKTPGSDLGGARRIAEAHSIEEVARILRTWGLP